LFETYDKQFSERKENYIFVLNIFKWLFFISFLVLLVIAPIMNYYFEMGIGLMEGNKELKDKNKKKE